MSNEPLTPTQERKVHDPTEGWSDDFALKVTTHDFSVAENYRTRNHDARWALADQLYCGWEKQKYWEGTKIERSSLGVFVLLSQLESLLPKVLSSIFADNPWFEVGPQPGTSFVEATQCRDLMLYQMEQMRRFDNQSVREVVRRAIKEGFLYGAGIVEVGWTDQVVRRRQLVREQVPGVQERQTEFGPAMFPTGQTVNRLMQQNVEIRHQRPFMRHIPTKDTYIDPNCQTPQIQTARYACTVGLKTVDELEALRDVEGFKIPPRLRLLELAKSRTHSQGEQAKQSIETARHNSYHPLDPSSNDPGSLPIEVITRWSRDRCVWVLNREDVAYNEINRYGVIPLHNSFYVDVPNRFYGLSLADVVEGEHRLQGSIINARVDELALTIHSARIKKKGRAIPAHQLRRRPGQVIEAEEPTKDVVTEKTQNITADAYNEIIASSRRVMENTGITDTAIMGVGSLGGNSANRTATGISTQASAAFSRLTYIVENIEDTFIEPVLSQWHQLNSQFLDPNEFVKILNPSGEQAAIDPLTVLNADIQFKMRASSKMQARSSLLMVLPHIMQTFIHPGIQGELAKMGKTLDFEELMGIILDISGYKQRGRFIRTLSPEEVQALQAAQQQQPNIELVKQRERMADMKEMQQTEIEGKLQQEIIKQGLAASLEPDAANF